MQQTILTYIQQDVTLHSLFYLENAIHVLGGTTNHHQERKQLNLQHLLFVTPLLLPAVCCVLCIHVYVEMSFHSLAICLVLKP
jgi:hypothetical protein